ncbi:Tetratricopeptide repeat protein 1 [Fulvia fulva]|uniref:Tetratricopeptide repeat protein 1 n=1 Tax=Passalora fulva TaxID=5499 RepID=A0A9Q8UQN5_PASFU|nr:Tetratricopeptide repeat protein 1 [Fulvia fulva]KAK4622120.1 Tetratricopeptide repeat protein 1 [Fulvia fulva]KAK4622597.1 Tetratricopeptide repeat protein 1 [Fulvia fulva]UJO18865.1 Tetratricopeptide repeat protein 1 [Fulvia fulva]WPV16142.1 Tetratricopeptide repeat protein 1 [Fulvia fulva]WPV31678.1 Tetratricopeptide repeat protein 1 [Fulvia fulva]
MAATANGHTNGVNGHAESGGFTRFADVPDVIDIPVGTDGEVVDLNLEETPEDPSELCDLLESENAARNYWVTIALAYVKQDRSDAAVEILKRALEVRQQGRSDERLSILVCLCWLYLWKCRKASRVQSTQDTTRDDRTKDHWLKAATSTLNDASRLNPSYPPLILVRGALNILRASLQQVQGERVETLKQATRNFEDAYKASNAKNLMAIMGKAKVQYSHGKYAEAYTLYQQVLERAPELIDPDPRIGIGCCLWQLGHKENAKEAWQRALALSEDSSIANIMLGLHYLDESNHLSTSDPEFVKIYTKAMTGYTQTAFKKNGWNALACVTFGGFFLLRKNYAHVERLARRAIEQTDLNAIASDGWYLLARMEHYQGDLAKAQDYYGKADQARGGDERGYLPAKFGVAQLKTLMQDFDGAKFRLEKIITTSKSVEAMTLLGILHAEDVFTAQASGSKDDKSDSRKKAVALLEQVRIAWKDAKRKITPDSSVLLNLARLYESDQPEKALACLQQVEQMEMDEISEEDLPEELEDEDAIREAKRNMLSPQLLNNIACFYFQADKHSIARAYFQSALNSSVSIQHRDESVDTDALVSTVSYNLARTYEAAGIEEEAQKVYTSLLSRHPDYVDANTRTAYLTLQTDQEKGAQAIKALLEADPSNLEIRALYGWYLNKNKKRTLQLSEDQEQRHYKHTLMTYDKHDIYSLTGMGNLNMAVARELPRDTDQHKERRTKTYMRAVEFFDKVLMLDPKNAYAAQGMGIAMAEDKKDTSAAVKIFTQLRESIKDASVHINLGHVFCELKQYSKSIENYELALQKSRQKDPQIMACLGRAWLLRGRAERNLEHFQMSLDLSKQALETAPDNINFRFNVAFAQQTLAQQMISQPEANKTLEDVEKSSKDLDIAIESFLEIAKSPNPPFPRGDIEQRANMGRNTMKRQLASAIERQAEYERKNATRIEEARKMREEQVRKREEEKRAALEKAEEQKRKIEEERRRMKEEDDALIAKKIEEEKAREEADYTTDEDGNRKKREKKPREKRQKRKKKNEDTDTEGDGLADGTGDERPKKSKSRPRSRATSTPASDGEPRQKKKRRLERKGTAVKSSKYKSTEMVEDSDEDDDAGIQPATQRSEQEETPAAETPAPTSTPGAPDDNMDDDDDDDDDEEEEEEAAVSRPSRRNKPARVLDDDDEDEEAPAANGDTSMVDETVGAAGDSDHGGD